MDGGARFTQLWICHLLFIFFHIQGIEALVFEKEPKGLIAVTGKNVTFDCKANEAGKVITYFWKFNGSFINEDNKNGFKFSTGSLQIINVTGTKHRGTYECVVFNKDIGVIKSRKAKLQIAYFVGKARFRNRKRRFDFGVKALTEGPIFKALPPPTIIWHYYKREFQPWMQANVTDLKGAYVTLQEDLMFPTFLPSYRQLFIVFVYHPTFKDAATPVFEDRFWLYVSGDYEECPNSTMTSFPTVTNKTVREGRSVEFECLAVAGRCIDDVLIKWSKEGKSLNETNRRLVLKDVTKKNHAGSYECYAELKRERRNITIPYVLNVIEKPKLVKAVKPIVSLPEDGILHPAVFDKTTSLKWYKDGSVIDKSSTLFEVLPNGNLKINNPSPALSGIYEMFYENQAGTKTASQTVNIDSRVGCGQKIFKLSGSITYNQDTPTWRDVTCTWIFQLPSAKQMQFKIKKFKFEFQKEAMLSIFEGSTASQSLSAKYSLSVAYVNGPFISMVFRTKASNVGSFSVDYWPTSEGPATTVATTLATKRSKVKPTTTKSTKQKPVKAKQIGCKGSSNTGAIIGGIFGALILIALIVLIIYREKVLQKCGRSGSANVKTSEPTLTPMFEVDKSEQTC